MNRNILYKKAVISAFVLCVMGCSTDKTENLLIANTKENNIGATVAKWVDPFIGTGGDHGQLHPAATIPFGMVQMGPETPGRPHAGYDFNSDVIEGFAHTRTAGVGCRGAGGSILMRADYDTPEVDEIGQIVPVKIHKSTENALAGYYETSYGEPSVNAKMTVSPSSGWQQYTFSKTGQIVVTLDTFHAYHENYGGNFSVGENGNISGMTSGPTVCKEGKFQFYFSMQPSTPPKSVTPLDKYRVQLHYDVNEGDTLEFHTGISSVDVLTAEKARVFDKKVGGFFNATKAAVSAWENALGKITISGNDRAKRLFYTHLYHIYQSPSNLTASVASYRASDGKIYSKGSHDYYFGWSIWDNFRTQLPLLTILEPEIMGDVSASLALLYQQGKQNWATEFEPLPTVRTEHSGIVLLDAWRKGIQSFDLNTLLPLLKKEADAMPRKSPDQILEAAYDDWAVSEFSRIVNNSETTKKYRDRAKNYRITWSEKFKNIDESTFDIMHGDGLYEGTLWQYRWFTPFDTAWVIEELGGPETYTNQLSEFFENELFNMGNQPDIQSPFMFTFGGAAWRTQRVVHDIVHTEMNHWYGTHEKKEVPFVGLAFDDSPRGMIPEMDNDAGTMSGWYVFTVLGLYPAVPGKPVYSLHTPQLKSAVINLDNGKAISIATDKDPILFPYISEVKLNGEVLDRAWITHAELINNAKLEFELQDTPNKEWAKENVYTTKLN